MSTICCTFVGRRSVKADKYANIKNRPLYDNDPEFKQ